MGLSQSYLFRSCGGKFGSQSWIGKGRYFVVDYAAGPVSYGPLQGEGMVLPFTFPQINSATKLMKSKLCAHMVSVVVGTIQHVFVPDMRIERPRIEPGELLVPLVVLKDHNVSVTDPSSPYYIDLKKIERSIQSGTYKVEIVLVEDSLHNHKQISMALQKSIRWETTQFIEKPFLESRRLFYFLKEISSDPLTHSLFLSNKGPTPSAILPIFIFSLFHTHPNLTLHSHAMVSTSQSGGIILQTNTPNIQLPFLYRGKTLQISGYDTNRNIISSLLSLLGGVLEPWKHFEPANRQLEDDYFWSTGYHPFGPWSSCTEVSSVYDDAVLRNALITSLHYSIKELNEADQLIAAVAQKYVYTKDGTEIEDISESLAFWTDLLYSKVQQPNIRAELEGLKGFIAEALQSLDGLKELIASNQFAGALEKSQETKEAISTLHQRITTEVHKINQKLLCCSVRSYLNTSLSNQKTLLLIFLLLILFIRRLPNPAILLSQQNW
eukprot:TRINITY_DN5591_c0_g1_i3.p1 TRINITY_DN5591_c0_g1~~TRINITY_DN5591_c0_g1_i3.p1  ORF type:complete len:494 (+),score=106.90 TRINITY_DN5591_c0_g1_i3:510-1991(+)